jgi:hypothetical protein
MHMNGILQGLRIGEWLVPELSVHVEAILEHHAQNPDVPILTFVPIPWAWRDWDENDLIAYHSVHTVYHSILL